MTTAGDKPTCKTCGSEMVVKKSNGSVESKCHNCGRQDCTVNVNCIDVKFVPMPLRGAINPLHKAFLEIIEEHGENGQVPIPKMMEELKKKGFGGIKLNG